MPIKFVTGKPGGGKGLRTMNLFWDALSKDDRLIVTNLPVLLDKLQEYCIDHGRPDINVWQRVRLLRMEEMPEVSTEKQYRQALRQFYTYRTLNGPPDVLPTDEDVELDLVTDRIDSEDGEESEGNAGVQFFVDEIHKLWHARKTSTVSHWVLEYAAEHRHFNDDVFFITQFLGQVDKQIRLMGQDYEIIKNRGKEKHMVFAGPRKFDVYTYLEAPNGSSVAHVTSSSFRLHKGGLCDCYKSASRGGKADQGRYAKGVPWWVMYASAAMFVFLLWAGATKGPKLLATGIAGEYQENRSALETKEDAQAERPVAERPRETSVAPGTQVRAIVQIGPGWMIWLSDGTRYRPGQVRVDKVTPWSVTIDGEELPMAETAELRDWNRETSGMVRYRGDSGL